MRRNSSFELIQKPWLLAESFQNQLAEQRVGPGEPSARELLRVVLVERFVHEAGPGVRPLQRVQAKTDFPVVRAG